MVVLLEGKKSSQKWLLESSAKVKKLKGTPCLALIRVGDDSASKIYLEKKKKACESTGIKSLLFEFRASATQAQIEKKIAELNSDKSVHAILVQVPIPSHIDVLQLKEKINPLKDADGFGPYNMGRLFMGNPQLVAATPAGVMRLLSDYNLSVKGKKCAVVGRSNIVGKPLALLLLKEDATVEIAHSKTPDLKKTCQTADFVFVAVGACDIVNGSMLKKNCVVVDIGINRPDEGKICGDCDFVSCSKVASYITPVPGGVGPMTIASLIANTLQAYKLQKNN